jgi:alkyl sulfatase BDS1-like metallo-beta-lactamase superfamily hydrolase
VLGHEAIPARLDRYRLTNGWNQIINARQFGGLPPDPVAAASRSFIPENVARPTETYRDSMVTQVGDLRIELHHDRGETDDHTWAWIPEEKALCVGDLLIWVFPNAGNPQKVQRYPGEWAQALRRMQGMGAELLIPAHGLPIAGSGRIDLVLGEVAGVLEYLVTEVLDRMNAGWRLDRILADVRVDEDVLARPWLNPIYDEPEFVVRNIWRQYGGWWDADPAHLKPSSAGALGGEVVALAGGVDRVLERAHELSESGDHRLACELVEFAVAAQPDSATAHGVRAEVYQARRIFESSLMAKGIYSAAAAESKAAIERLGDAG